ncbi:hypothetical protein EPA93_39025 [Ktedonosporobacter rubrisoli]|uniref:Uncharacterized protein n=1 Tax=Ktedonosporobacter rubrisoli TaxID=2509675 RepID=A0A4P6K2D9_KTERU|nr:hypothetical protein [Ktedonosporobacter rubrisoli]QBD81646.1 hypothetical protein EPA93_39025 [Ktedonosporobacter rubrisoli]
MARSGVPSTRLKPPELQEQPGSASSERRFRRISAWLLWFFALQGELGVIWDREWHAHVGRDQFWTPPHMLMYSGVAGAGLLALLVVLLDTIRYRRAIAGVNDKTTIQVFKIFHAPLGAVVTGFGALIGLIAAPLDNYWHELYGIDVALWAPFHMMGVIGGLIGMLGIIYLFAAEAAIERAKGSAVWRLLGLNFFEWGALLTMVTLLNFTLTGFLMFPVVDLGPLQISTYPLPLIMCGAFCFVAALRLTYRPGVATLMTLILVMHTLVVELFVPWAIRTAVAEQGLAFRDPNDIPVFRWDYALLPFLFIVSVLIFDGIALWYRRRGEPSKILQGVKKAGLLGMLITLPAVPLTMYILRSYSIYAPIFLPRPGLEIPMALWIGAIAGTAITTLLAGFLGGMLGSEFGDIWRWNTR